MIGCLLSDLVEASLRKVEGRRNPNSAQMKELSATLPSLPTLLHLLTSRSLGPHALAATNMEQLCDLIKMVRPESQHFLYYSWQLGLL